MPLYLFWGEEEFNIENSVQELKNKILDPGWSLLNHKVLIEPDITSLIEALQTMPMVFGNLLIEVRSTNLFLRGSKKPAGSDTQIKRLLEILENINDNQYVLFVCQIPRDSGRKIDSVLKLTKTIEKFGKIEAFDSFKFYQEKEIINWITKQAGKKGVKISSEAALSLFLNTGTELRRLDSELDKLSLSIYPNKTITKDEVMKLCSTHENVFLLADYLLLDDKSKAILELQKLFEKDHPLKIISTLHTVLRRWIIIKLESKDKSAFDISKIVNLHKFVVEKETQKLKNISVDSLLKIKEKLTQAESRIKSGEMESELALETAIIS